MSCSVESLERAARQFDALAAGCLDEPTAALYRAKARALREALEVADSAGFLLGCGE